MVPIPKRYFRHLHDSSHRFARAAGARPTSRRVRKITKAAVVLSLLSPANSASRCTGCSQMAPHPIRCSWGAWHVSSPPRPGIVPCSRVRCPNGGTTGPRGWTRAQKNSGSMSGRTLHLGSVGSFRLNSPWICDLSFCQMTSRLGCQTRTLLVTGKMKVQRCCTHGVGPFFLP